MPLSRSVTSRPELDWLRIPSTAQGPSQTAQQGAALLRLAAGAIRAQVLCLLSSDNPSGYLGARSEVEAGEDLFDV